MSEFIKIGDTGEIVSKIQEILIDNGYKLTVDSDFGPSTENAIKEFQHKQQIKVDGLVGPKTLELLFLSAGFHPAEAYINSFSFLSDTNYALWVNTETNRVHLFKGKNHNWFLINSYLASITKAPTILGVFKVGEKSKKLKADRQTYLKWNTYFFERCSFSSLYFKNKTNDINQNKNHSIRLSEDNAKFIYENIPKGSTILIN